MWQKCFFFLMYQKFYINKSLPDIQPSCLPYFLFLSVTIACSADTVTLTPPRAPFLTLPQLLLAFLFKAVCVSTYASWHKYLSDLLATSTGCVPGKHRATTFTRRKKRREKKLAEKEDWQAWREDWQKNWVNTDVCPSHPPFDWAESLSPYTLQLSAGDPATRLLYNTCFSPSSSPTVSDNMLQWD